MSHLTDKRLVIIGGSSGIGLAVAELAAQRGCRLIIVGRNISRLELAQKNLSTYKIDVTTYQCDAHNTGELKNLFDKIPKFDHLISMVGDVMGGGFLQSSMEEIRRVLDSKFFTNVAIGQLSAEKLNPGGSLIFTSGTGGRAQDACASYVGNQSIVALVEGLAAELAPEARVNTVAPTWTVTPFWRDLPQEDLDRTRRQFEQSIPLGRTAAIDDLATTYLYLLENQFITGQQIAVDGGIMLGT